MHVISKKWPFGKLLSTQRVPRLQALRWLGWLTMVSVVPLLLFSMRYFYGGTWPQDNLTQIFLTLVIPSHFISLTFMALLMVIPIIIVVPRYIVLSLSTIMILSILTVILLIDSMVYSLYRFHLNGMVWSLIVNGGISEILPLAWYVWFFPVVVFMVIIAIEIVLATMVWRWIEKSKRHGIKWFGIILGVIICGQFIHGWADANHYTEVTRVARVLPLYPGATMQKTLLKLGMAAKSNALSMDIPGAASDLNYPREHLNCQPPPNPMNVLMIVIDSWRFDMLTPAVTPAMTNFANQASQFTQHWSSGNATRFGVFGLFYGIFGTYWHALLAEERGPVLLDTFDQHHYDFGVFASAQLTSPEFNRTVFSALRTRIPLSTKGDDAVQRDQNITAAFLDFLNQRDAEKPFFGFLFYDAPHSYLYPIDSPEPFKPVWKSVNHLALNQDFDPTPYRNRFLNSIHFVDSLIGQVLDDLAQRDLLTNTVVVITGDHGEEFNETQGNYWGHAGNFSRYQTQVPMIVHFPGKPAKQWQHLTTHLDIAPTLLNEVLGCSTPMAQYSNGRLLFNQSPRDFLLVSDWNRFAVLTPGNIDVIYNAGYTESYNEDYQIQSQSLQDSQLMLNIMEGMSRFFAK